MNMLNPCVTGSTKVWTVDGFKSMQELAEANEDVNVYCLDVDGNIRISKMFHPRITGYNIELFRIILSDDSEFCVSPNHMFLTRNGYISADELNESHEVIAIKSGVRLPSDILQQDRRFTDFTPTKKGTVIKRCEVTDEEFECVWDEREVCTKNGYESDLYGIKSRPNTNSKNYEYKRVKSVEYLEERENVYNGTVAVYHNYFTTDDRTNTIVNQLNCGE